MLTRRQFLQLSGLGAASVAAPWPVRRALAAPAVPLDPLTQPKFVTPLPNPLAPSFIYEAPASGPYQIGMGQTTQSLGLIDPLTNTPLLTTIWGYTGKPKVGAASITYPGRTFVAMKDSPVTVKWQNNLILTSHLLPVDTTLAWALGADHRDADGNPVSGSTFEGAGGIPAVAHLHGGHNESDSDGLPEQWWTPGGYTGLDYIKDLYTYHNNQQAATLWYHDHALGITRLNVYAGLAGFYILRDTNEVGLGLPGSPYNADGSPQNWKYEIPLVIQDRMFTATGQLLYPSDPLLAEVAAACPQNAGGICDPLPNPTVLPESFGDHILVNGVAWPVHHVEPRKYRFRLLNGSDSRFYDLFFNTGNTMEPNGPQFWVIGNDTGLLNAPVPVQRLTVGPGERYDVVVDFSGALDGVTGAWANQTLIVRNMARIPFPKGATPNPRTDGQIMAFVVDVPLDMNVLENPLPAVLNTINPLTTGLSPRKLMLFEATDHYGRLQPLLGTVDNNAACPVAPAEPTDGTFLWTDAPTEDPVAGTTETWEVYNATVDAHPIHLHLVAFQILDRQKFTADVCYKTNSDGHGGLTAGGALANIRLKGRGKGPGPYEAGWKDTAVMYPGEVTRIIARFDPQAGGNTNGNRYVWHCHILSHEDHEMMRRYTVV